MRFCERLSKRIAAVGGGLCLGLDPRQERIEGSIEAFLEEVIEQTHDVVAAYKPNIAYFEALGADGMHLLERTLKRIPAEVPVILDAKRSDIPETQRYYAKAYFEGWDVDAVTVNPYLGFDSIEPYLAYEGKGVYLLAVTSNEGAKDLQLTQAEGGPVFERVTWMSARAEGAPADLGFVMGLTHLDAGIWERVPDAPLLLPGLGAQGGKLEALSGTKRSAPLLVNSSRSILYGEQGSVRDRALATKEKVYDVLGS